MPSSRSSCRYILTAAAILFTLLLFGAQLRSFTSWTNGLIPGLLSINEGSAATVKCHDLPGANETLVVLKTGAGEIEEKLPIHLQTTFKCYPNTVIFSDFGETFMNHTIVDVLEDVDPEIKDNHDDFELYRKLQRGGRAALAPSELSTSSSHTTSLGGNPRIPGWTLDKYKFLPMMRKTLELHPEMKWYVFVEADTYIFWTSLLAYAAALDPDAPHYIGGQNSVGDIEFAHGGTGFLVSRPALEMVVAEYVAHKSDWEVLTRDHWCGDCVLGKAFKDAGVPLTAAWPIWQGDKVGNMNYDRVDDGVRRQWCPPTVSYHHLSIPAIRDLWEFEQKWIFDAENVSTLFRLCNHATTTSPTELTQTPQTSSNLFLRHRDVFAEYILPRTTSNRSDWDNHSDKELASSPSASPEDCNMLCETDVSCLQWAFSAEGKCLSTSKPNLGEPSNETVSGWIPRRMQQFYDDGPVCGDVEWIS
jgi:hypothetical protein